MPREITHHGEILKAIRNSGVLSDLVEEHKGHFTHELDLELIVYGRTYGEHQVGPYARLLVYGAGEKIIHQGEWKRNAFYILLNGRLDVLKDDKGVSKRVHELESQNIFGEMSVLAGRPSNATVVVPNGIEATVLEIQRPALRLLRKLKTFETRLDYLYRQHGLGNTLQDIKEGTQNAFNDELLERLKKNSSFIVHPKGHVLAQEGHPIEMLVFVKNGWICRERYGPKLTETGTSIADLVLNDKVKEVDHRLEWDFLGPGNWLGLEAIDTGDEIKWKYTSTIMSRTEVLEIQISSLRSDPVLVEMMRGYFPHFSPFDDKPPETPTDRQSMNAAAKEIATGVVDATNLLVMDMDKCIRCGNCSLACHKVHGKSRLTRHGIHITRPVKPGRRATQHVLSPSVCLHCQDPECLTGCPTGAISRFEIGQIDIDPKTCIGCGDCATQCPYDAISMIPRESVKPQPQALMGKIGGWFSLSVPQLSNEITEGKDLLAVKCNLCQDTPLNPKGAKKGARKPAYSCEENCPTGALVRVNPLEYFSEAKNSIGIVFQDRTHAVGRNIHKKDVPARVFHALGLFTILTITGVVLWAARRHTLDAHLEGTWLTMRWVTGLLGLGSIVLVLTYPFRKQIYKRRVGPLRYWKLAHSYLGLLAGIVLLIHGGRDSGGLLTSMLMVSFDVAIVSGLFGVSCYFIVPRIMTSIEGDPLLYEDLQERREELRETLGLIDTSDDRLHQLVKVKMRKRFFSFSYLVRQYFYREDLATILAGAREEFREDAKALTDQQARDSLMTAVETTATLRRVDSLIYLHQLLKLWLAPHVVSVSIMLALLCVHVVQVSLFTVR
jgi:Fe-S-cluster-containing dehydrogenase component/CRP-like cAMP-binding protein